jgi:mono/diheme cytochrome c family protein
MISINAPPACMLAHATKRADKVMRAQLLFFPALLLTACASPQDAIPQDPILADGQSLARENCASCHAIGAADRSRHPDAIAFRDISKNYPVSALEESFAEGIMVGHPDMPEFRMQPSAIRALIAWMESVQAD